MDGNVTAFRCAALVCALATACGGNSTKESESSEPAGPVREGKGLYELRIERVVDDCVPALIAGKMGPVTVWVAREADGVDGTVNIPIYWNSPSGPARTDVALVEPLVFEVSIGQPNCSAAKERHEYTTLRADAARIDVEWKVTRSGLETCSPQATTNNCTVDRIYHFRWLRSCALDDDVDACH